MAAVLVEDSLSTLGQIEDIQLPAPPLMYAMAGVFRPGTAAATRGFEQGEEQVLVYEAMRFSFFEDLPAHRQFVTDYHADAPLIGAQAAALGVPKLVLTHLIPAPRSERDRQQFVDEVRSGGYGGELVVADDLYTCAVGDGGLPEVAALDATAEQG